MQTTEQERPQWPSVLPVSREGREEESGTQAVS
jgi:hypothetical protein